MAVAMARSHTLSAGHGCECTEATDPGTEEQVLDRQTAASVDAVIVAERNGWEPKATLSYLEQSRRFADLAAELGREFTNEYAGATFAERPGVSSLVRFVDQPPSGAIARIDKSELAVRIEGGAQYSEVALQERAPAQQRDLPVHQRVHRPRQQRDDRGGHCWSLHRAEPVPPAQRRSHLQHDPPG